MALLFLDESGQGIVEYGLILALMALAVIGSLSAFGGGVQGLYDRSIAQMPFGKEEP